MVCSSCGRATKAGARFCGGCGASLAPRCPACGAESEPDTRFCEACGASLAAPTATAAAVARKVVTIVFADLIGSTALQERLDPESVSRIMEGYHAAVRAPVEAHGGTVVQLLGDGVMCAFGVPRVAEDDALRAVRAAVDVQRSFREFLGEHPELASRVGLRVAVNTGEVVVSDDYAAGIGDPLNVAARLQQEAKDGDVLIGEATQRLVAAQVTLARVGSFALKGRAEPVTAYRVVSLERPAGAAATPFVGRDDELRCLTAVYDAAIAKPAARLALVLGSPGLGKSRLLVEFGQRLGDGASVITAQCVAIGGATFAPLAEALRAHLQLEAGSGDAALRAALDAVVPGDEAERARIASGVGALLAGTPASPEETFFVVRRLLAAFATKQPVVLAIDDFQWAEPLLLDFTEHLVQWGAGVPLLVLAAARPELRDTRSSLTIPGGLVSDVVTLGGLDAGAATRLAANVIGADALPAAVAGRVLTASEGNPLFLGELVRMLVNDGALRKEGERWSLAVDLAELEMPPTIQALLAARIERLRPEERLVLERAAVVGRQFSRAAISHLLPREALADLDARLESLRRSELVEPDTGWLLGEPALRFHHGLIRDAAYRRVLRGTRAELHARYAEWLEARVGESAPHEETIGWHLEQAHQHLRELGSLDADGRALGERAARYLAEAGRRALAHDDLQPAASLLGRALACLGDADPARADLTVDWCEALLSARDVGPAARALAELGRFTAGSERLRAWHACFTAELAVLTDPKPLRASAAAVEAAAETLAAAGDTAGEAKAHWVQAIALARLGQGGAGEAALDKALAAARRVRGDRRRANEVLAVAPLFALWGPSPVTRASGRCLDVVRVLRITQGAPAVEAVALRCQAVLEALRGRSEAARRMIVSSRRMVEELGITQRVLEADVSAGLIELLEGDAVAAERWLRGAYGGLRERGLGIVAAQAAALLGRALLAEGRVGEAEALSHESEALAGDDLKAAIAWRGVRAEALARRGEYEAAIDFASKGVEIAAATDGLLDHADARLALAVALRAAGRSAEAQSEETRAIELWEQKGATLLVERARRAAGRGAQVDRAAGDRVDPTRPERRVQANAATAHAAREEATFAARDAGALATLFADDVEAVDHPNGATYGQLQILTALGRQLRAQDLTRRYEPLATLGDALALCHLSLSAGGIARGDFDVGPYESEQVVLFEVDGQGRCWRAEFFAPERLGDAIARLYERYAELLPEGPERTRAAATARSVAAQPLFRQSAEVVDGSQLAPEVEFIDHRTVGMGSGRGAETLLRGFRALRELTETWAARVDDILALRSDALLVRWTNSGTQRAGGGAYERHLLQLWVFGADGLVERWEQFDAEQAAEALARFDELTAEPPPARPVRRRVRPNAATANAAHLDSAFAARDSDAFSQLLGEHDETIDHTTGATYGRSESLAFYGRQLRVEDLRMRQEPLATLGESLALCRYSVSGSGATGKTFDVGAFEYDNHRLIEVDAGGRRRRIEVFAADRLGDAIARLYERYAELLPDGPERTRAVATARAVSAFLGPFDIDRYAEAFAPTIEVIDARTLGTWSARGAEATLQQFRSLLEVADDITLHEIEVFSLQPDALLGCRTHRGTDRAGGGSYERQFLMVLAFGSDGLMTRLEWFDADRVDQAFARFDALTAAHPAAVSRVAAKGMRRVGANAATQSMARINVAFAARDADAVSAALADPMEHIDHPLGAVYGREGVLANVRAGLKARDLSFVHEPIAVLGDSLALSHRFSSASGGTGKTFDVGAYEQEAFVLIEGDARARMQRVEVFAAGHLGDAITRLYERYAEFLPEGPEQVRAAATARSVVTVLGPYDTERYNAAHSPAIEYFDHRTHGVGPLTGPEEVARWFASLLEVAEGVANRFDDIVGLQSDALLLRWTNFGTERAGGGAYERHFLWLGVFGSDGLVTRIELFEGDRDAQALARFDELTAGPPPARPVRRRVRPNAAIAHGARVDVAIAARDADALPNLLADSCEVIDHPTGATFGGPGLLATWRTLLSARDPALRHEPLATLGDSLALCRVLTSASGFSGRSFDVGAYEREGIGLIEVDANGRRRRHEGFAPDRLGDAVLRMYERYAELLPEGPERTRAAATARSFAAMAGPLEPDRYASAFAPAIQSVDHRTLGTWSARGAVPLREHFRASRELADDIVLRDKDILGLQSDAFLVSRIHSGNDRAGGGPYERPYLMLGSFGVDGLVTRIEWFDTDRDAEALARFDELTAEPPETCFANAAWRAVEESDAAMERRDWDALVACYAPGLVLDDRRSLVRTFVSGEAAFAHLRFLFDARRNSSRQLLATRGDRLALQRVVLTSAASHGGLAEFDMLLVAEVDATGRRVAGVAFDPDDLDAAYAELDERYGATKTPTLLLRSLDARDWEAVAALLAPDLVIEDHRLLGWGTLHGPPAYIGSLQALVELAPDASLRFDHREDSGRGALGITMLEGTREGGAFEDRRVVVAELDAQGRIRRFDFYDPDHLDQARARFDAIAGTPRDPLAALARPNAASAALDRLQTAFEARDWMAVRALAAESARFEDRRRHALVAGDVGWWIADLKQVAAAEVGDVHYQRTLVVTAGDRVCLERVLWAGGPVEGRVEIEYLWLAEADADGRLVAGVMFDVDDWRAATREGVGRWLARDAAAAAILAPLFELTEATNDRDRARVRAVLADDLVVHDRRLAGQGEVAGADAYLDTVAVLWDLAPDIQIEPRSALALESHGMVGVSRTFGTLSDGGGAFERCIVQVATVASGRVTRLELFEIDHLDAALARFAELRPDPTRIPANAASRANDLRHAAWQARDWAALRALASPDFSFEDRSKLALVSGDVEMWIENNSFVEPAPVEREQIGTAGDRIALERVLWKGESDGGPVEREHLRLTEVAADGRIRASIRFDLEDRSAAFAEAGARFVAGEAAAIRGQAPIVAFMRAYVQYDWKTARGCLADDFVLRDHRTLGLGALGREEWIESLRVMADLAPGWSAETVRILAWNRHGRADVSRHFGTTRDGGPFENVFVRVVMTGGDCIQSNDTFDVADTDRALARFEELCAQRL